MIAMTENSVRSFSGSLLLAWGLLGAMCSAGGEDSADAYLPFSYDEGGSRAQAADDTVAAAVAEISANYSLGNLHGVARTFYRSCEAVGPCLNDGFCFNDTEFRGFRCMCQLGYSGRQCEKESSAKFPRFFGRSYIALPAPRESHERINITIEFKPERSEGVLLYSGRNFEATGDFMSLSFRKDVVEFRFDCGSGMAVLKVQGQLRLHDWNTVIFGRHDADGFIRVNNGDMTYGKSPGPYTYLTVRTPLLVGSIPYESASSRVGVMRGFAGCIGKTTVNGRLIDMRRKAFIGDAIYGLDIDDCAAGLCESMSCANGGYCVIRSASEATCLCPLGAAGPLCERFMPVSMPAFNGIGYLRFAGIQSDTPYYTTLEVLFKASRPDGLILYTSATHDRMGDFVSLAILDGRVDFRFDLGNGPAILRSKNLVTLHDWHSVVATREGRAGELVVDGRLEARGQSPGQNTRLSPTESLFVGGHSDYDAMVVQMAEVPGLHGCVQKVIFNHEPLELLQGFREGKNTEDCMHTCANSPCLHRATCRAMGSDYSCQCALGYEGRHCETVKQRPLTPMFNGDGYLKLENSELNKALNSESLSMQLQIRARSSDGLLLWYGQSAAPNAPRSDYLAIGITGGNIHLAFNLGSGSAKMNYTAVNVSDGKWHVLRIDRTKQDTFMQVDTGALVSASSPGRATWLNAGPALYIGGVPDSDTVLDGRPSQWVPSGRKGFTGCLRRFTVRNARGNATEVNVADEATAGQNVFTCDSGVQ